MKTFWSIKEFWMLSGRREGESEGLS